MVSKKAPMYTRPEELMPGDTWMERVSEIMSRPSVDGGSADNPGQWETLLVMKRKDRHYENLRKSIEQYGFHHPLVVYVHDRDNTDYWGLGDGHHRLAIAIDLGMSHVPVIVEYDNAMIEDEENYLAEYGWMENEELNNG